MQAKCDSSLSVLETAGHAAQQRTQQLLRCSGTQVADIAVEAVVEPAAHNKVVEVRS